MTVLIGYVPTPVGEAALAAGLAEAAAHGDDVVILNSPRRGSTSTPTWSDPDARPSCSRPRPAAGVTARIDHTDHGADIVDAFTTAVEETGRPPGRDRPAPPLAGRQADDGQRRPATAARRSTCRSWPSSPLDDRRGSRGSSSPRSPSPTRRCSTSSASTSRGRCARSSRSTRTPACSGLGETYADEAHLARLPPWPRRSRHRPLRPRVAPSGRGRRARQGDRRSRRQLRRHARRRLAVETVYSPFEVACLDLQGHAPAGRSASCSAGAVRDRVPFSGYLFYKWAGHPGSPDDAWGEALNPAQLVAQARRMVDGWGFGRSS